MDVEAAAVALRRAHLVCAEGWEKRTGREVRGTTTGEA